LSKENLFIYVVLALVFEKMHEINIAERVFREAVNAGATRFLKVEIGELCEITKEELEEGLSKVTGTNVVASLQDFGGSVLQKPGEVGDLDFGEWKFDVVGIESKIKCSCGFEGKAKILDRGHGYCLYGCPACGLSGGDVKVLDGGEIKVVGVE
jgi:Zn finger protein HypA/HybF involved in hydrogenase expression